MSKSAKKELPKTKVGDLKMAELPPGLMPQVDYTSVSETYVDALGGVSVRNGVARLNFMVFRNNADGSLNAQPGAVLTLSIPDLLAAAEAINGAIEQLKGAGLISDASQGVVK